jgi:hypothetical protein
MLSRVRALAWAAVRRFWCARLSDDWSRACTSSMSARAYQTATLPAPAKRCIASR